MAQFIGRDLELTKLRDLTRLRAPSLAVIKGRRRVGKSRLATEFADYTRFYFRCIKPNKGAVDRRAARLPAGSDGTFGLQFENLILKNRAAVWAQLRIGAEDIVFDNPYWQTATRRTRGCQLDYVIQCRNNTVYVCEIKFSKAPLPRATIAEVDGKIRSIAKPRNFTFRPVLIHVNGVDDAVVEARYFDAIIDFGELWR
jgi:uncharacterized protein